MLEANLFLLDGRVFGPVGYAEGARYLWHRIPDKNGLPCEYRFERRVLVVTTGRYWTIFIENGDWRAVHKQFDAYFGEGKGGT